LHRVKVLSAALCLIAASAAAAADPVFFADDEISPGDVVQAVITGEPMEDMVVALQDNQGRTLSRAEGFIWHSPAGRSVSVALLGIPSTALPGRYTLVLNAREGRADWHLERYIDIIEEAFPESVIILNDKMNDIAVDDSERKKSEAREFWAVLTSFDPQAVHHPGPLLPPLKELVETAGYGDRRRYRMPDGTETVSVHFGKDLRAGLGTPVTSSGKGRVSMASERLLTGNTVIIEHMPGVYSIYYHMDSLSVKKGEMVKAGDNIGTVGETGFATGVHLHWELRVGAVPVKPELFLQKPLLDTIDLAGKM
jgi:murein DD-endopeptidase MepM/ murein hydrolase activator NlpD